MIYNEDCIKGAAKLDDESVDLIICDPPFGINEADFDKHYKRDSDGVVDGYVEAPADYYQFSYDWISQCHRVLKDEGSMFIISGWTHLLDLMRAVADVGFSAINHIIWKFNFGVATTRKFVSAHYHVLYLKKRENTRTTFNLHSRFGSHQKNESGGSLLYQDLEDVWVINKEYRPGKQKNQNKLPEDLVKKIVLYASNEGDLVCDFFMGNFTTAVVSKKLNRRSCGFEINEKIFQLGMAELEHVVAGCDVKTVECQNPGNQGKPLSKQEVLDICSQFHEHVKAGMTRKKATFEVGREYGRGRFSIKNILDEHYTASMPFGRQFMKTRGWICPFCGVSAKSGDAESLDEMFCCPSCEDGRRGWLVQIGSKKFSYELL